MPRSLARTQDNLTSDVKAYILHCIPADSSLMLLHAGDVFDRDFSIPVCNLNVSMFYQSIHTPVTSGIMALSA